MAVWGNYKRHFVIASLPMYEMPCGSSLRGRTTKRPIAVLSHFNICHFLFFLLVFKLHVLCAGFLNHLHCLFIGVFILCSYRDRSIFLDTLKCILAH